MRIGLITMANWKYKIDISKEHHAFEDAECDIYVVVDKLVAELKMSPYAEYMDFTIERLESLRGIPEDEAVEEYDELLQEVYDFGNENHRLWVNTI